MQRSFMLHLTEANAAYTAVYNPLSTMHNPALISDKFEVNWSHLTNFRRAESHNTQLSRNIFTHTPEGLRRGSLSGYVAYFLLQ